MKLHIQTQQLKGFIAVAQSGSFSKAAEKTGRSQPAVSLQIKTLERDLKTTLFDRLGGQKTELTDEGKILFDLASPLLNGIEDLQAKFNDARGATQKGSVKIATHSSVMTYLLPEIIKGFIKKYPDCDLSIVNRSRKDIIGMLKDGDVDLGITSLDTIPDFIDYRVFAKYNRVLITPKGHPLAKKPSIRLEDIAKYPLLISPRGSNTRTIIDRKFQEKNLNYQVAMEVAGRQPIKTYVQMGLGISVINEYYLAGEDKKKLHVVDVSKYFGKAERGVLTRKGKYCSKHTKELINILAGR